MIVLIFLNFLQIDFSLSLKFTIREIIIFDFCNMGLEYATIY